MCFGVVFEVKNHYVTCGGTSTDRYTSSENVSSQIEMGFNVMSGEHTLQYYLILNGITILSTISLSNIFLPSNGTIHVRVNISTRFKGKFFMIFNDFVIQNDATHQQQNFTDTGMFYRSVPMVGIGPF